MPGADDSYIHEILKLEPLLRAFLHRFARKPSDLDDLVQETYARLLGLDDEARRNVKNTHAFALTTARNIAIDWKRHSRNVPFDVIEEIDAFSVITDGNSVEQIVNAHQELLLLVQAIATLPTRCAEVFTLRKLYGFSQPEIAARLGISISTVEAQLVKAVKRCKPLIPASHVQQRQARRKSRWPWKGERG